MSSNLVNRRVLLSSRPKGVPEAESRLTRAEFADPASMMTWSKTRTVGLRLGGLG